MATGRDSSPSESRGMIMGPSARHRFQAAGGSLWNLLAHADICALCEPSPRRAAGPRGPRLPCVGIALDIALSRVAQAGSRLAPQGFSPQANPWHGTSPIRVPALVL